MIPLHLDPLSGQPLYLQIVEQLEEAVRTGALKDGDAVWSARRIASHHHVAYQTAERALAELARRGVVRRSVATGTVVCGGAARRRVVEHRVVALISCWEVWGSGPTYTMAELAMHQAAAHALTERFWGLLSVSLGSGDVPHGFSTGRLAGWCRRSRFDGAIIFGNMPERGLQWLSGQGYPLVVADSDPEGPYPRVVHDNRGGMRAAVEALLAAGHRRIAFVRGNRPYHYHERESAYREALMDAGIALDPELIVCVHRPKPMVTDAVDFWLDLPPGRRPTAIAAGSDLLAAQTIQTLRARGLALPDDCSVTGYDDEPFAAMLDPPLTTLRVSWADMGRAAADLLLEVIDNGDGGADEDVRRVVVSACLVQRKSVGPPRGRGADGGGA